VPIHSEIDIQAARILELCTQSVPSCIVQVMPVGPDSFKLNVKDGKNVLLESDLPLCAHELATKSDDELWKLLEKVSRQRIKTILMRKPRQTCNCEDWTVAP
jgi:hypothetical protein